MGNAKKLTDKYLFLSNEEPFLSIQGEGSTIGTPSVFLRLQYCNLRCPWCDTKYTWSNFEKKVSIENIANTVSKYNIKRLVITGGEPFLQKDLIHLIKKLKNWSIEIETNGTITPCFKVPNNVQLNISPKIFDNILTPSNFKLLEKNIKLFLNYNSFFKFVIGSRSNFNDMIVFLKKNNIPSHKVIVMPLGVTVKENKKNMLAIIDLALKNNIRILNRMHILLWGKRKRV